MAGGSAAVAGVWDTVSTQSRCNARDDAARALGRQRRGPMDRPGPHSLMTAGEAIATRQGAASSFRL
eukprot:354206-Chlamydomonas_euryale.AAC.5